MRHTAAESFHSPAQDTPRYRFPESSRPVAPQIAYGLVSSGSSISVNSGASFHRREGSLKTVPRRFAVVRSRGSTFGWDCSDSSDNSSATQVAASASVAPTCSPANRLTAPDSVLGVTASDSTESLTEKVPSVSKEHPKQAIRKQPANPRRFEVSLTTFNLISFNLEAGSSSPFQAALHFLLELPVFGATTRRRNSIQRFAHSLYGESLATVSRKPEFVVTKICRTLCADYVEDLPQKDARAETSCTSRASLRYNYLLCVLTKAGGTP